MMSEQVISLFGRDKGIREKRRRRGILLLKVLFAFGMFVFMGGKAVASERPVTHSAGQYVHQEAFEQNQELKGITDSFNEYFYVGDWNIEDAFLTLYYEATPLVDQSRSNYTVSLNGRPIYSDTIKAEGQAMQGVRIPLPASEMINGMNLLSVSTYVRTVVDVNCTDEVSGAAWMSVERESAVTISYRPLLRGSGIARFYDNFLSVEALENGESAVVIPEQASNAELTMAANAFLNLSAAARPFGTEILMGTGNEGQKYRESCRYLIYLAEYDSLEESIAALLTEEQKKQAETAAVMALLAPDANTSVLLITGSDQNALTDTVRLLGNKSYMRQIGAGWKKTSAGMGGLTAPVNKDGKVVLAERYLHGPFRQTASYYIEEAAGKRLAEGTELQLSFRYADNLDFSRALVTVYVNGQPAGSQKLTQKNASNDSFILKIPDDIETAGAFELSVSFDLEMAAPICEVRRQDMPWAYIAGSSELLLRTKENPYLLFEYYPHPFLKEGAADNIMVLLPEQPSAADLDTMHSVLLYMGQSQERNTGTVRVETGFSEKAEQEAGAYHIISIGILEDNILAKRYNENLYFTFSPKGTTIVSNEKMEIEPAYGAGLGTVQLLPSPFKGQDRALLIISGVKESGMLKAAAYLEQADKSGELYGDGYVADADAVYCFRFGRDNAKTESVWEDVKDQESVLLYMTTGGVTVCLILVTLLLLFIKYKKQKIK